MQGCRLGHDPKKSEQEKHICFGQQNKIEWYLEEEFHPRQENEWDIQQKEVLLRRD